MITRPHLRPRVRRNPEVLVRVDDQSTWAKALNKYTELALSDPYHLYGLSFTNAVDDRGRIKLGVYPKSKSHDDPKGVFAYPIGYAVDIAYGKNMKAWAVIRVPIPARAQNAVIINDSNVYSVILRDIDGVGAICHLPMYGTPEHKLLEIARNNGWYTWAYNALNGDLDYLVSYMSQTGDTIVGGKGARPPAGRWYHAAKALTNDTYINYGGFRDGEIADEVENLGYAHMKWGSSLRGVPYIYDVGTGSIHHAEPAQFVVLDTRIMDIVDYGMNKATTTPVRKQLKLSTNADEERVAQHLLDLAIPPGPVLTSHDATNLSKTVMKLVRGEPATMYMSLRRYQANMLAAALGVSGMLSLVSTGSSVIAKLHDVGDLLSAKRARPAVARRIYSLYMLLVGETTGIASTHYTLTRRGDIVDVTYVGVGGTEQPIRKFRYSTGEEIP